MLAEFESSKSVLIGWAEERGDLRPFSLTPEETRFCDHVEETGIGVVEHYGAQEASWRLPLVIRRNEPLG